MVCVSMAARGACGQGDAAGKTDASAPPAFEVVSVKPVDPDLRISMIGLRRTADGIESQSVTLPMLIRFAYGGFMKLPTDDSVTGLPAWAKTANFQVSAKMSEADAADFAKLSKDEQDQRREQMVQTLLAERFELKMHHGSKQAADYELVVTKGGPKFKEGTSDFMGSGREAGSGQLSADEWDGKGAGAGVFDGPTGELPDAAFYRPGAAGEG
jgi:uncharacterized protein (TIGR03435 family)